MAVMNRKLFADRQARNTLRNMGGIMASYPELLETVQTFQDGAEVRVPSVYQEEGPGSTMPAGSTLEQLASESPTIRALTLSRLGGYVGDFIDEVGMNAIRQSDALLASSVSLGARGAAASTAALGTLASVLGFPNVGAMMERAADTVAQRREALMATTDSERMPFGLEAPRLLTRPDEVPTEPVYDPTETLQKIIMEPRGTALFEEGSFAEPISGYDLLEGSMGVSPEVPTYQPPSGIVSPAGGMPANIPSAETAPSIGATPQQPRDPRIQEIEAELLRQRLELADEGYVTPEIPNRYPGEERLAREEALRNLASQMEAEAMADDAARVVEEEAPAPEAPAPETPAAPTETTEPDATRAEPTEEDVPSVPDETPAIPTDLLADPGETTGDLRSRYADRLKLFQEVLGGADEQTAQDKAMQLAMIGLAIAAGQSPDALTNISQGALAGLTAMSEQEAERRAQDRELRAAALEAAIEDVNLGRRLASDERIAAMRAGEAGESSRQEYLFNSTFQTTYDYLVNTEGVDPNVAIQRARQAAAEAAPNAPSAMGISPGVQITPEQEAALRTRIESAQGDEAQLSAIRNAMTQRGLNPSDYGL